MQDALKTVAPAITLTAIHEGNHIRHEAWGACDHNTLFDLASLTKLFTTTALLVLASRNTLSLQTPLVTILPDFDILTPRFIDGGQDPHTKRYLPTPPHLNNVTVDPSKVTLWHLLTHTSGLPAWRSVYEAGNWENALDQMMGYAFVDHIGVTVRYSDIGYMLLGAVVAKLNQSTLDAAIQQYVIDPLEVTDILFNPLSSVAKDRIAPTELDETWRKKRLQGEVHDENAYGVGGVAGHAGLFGTADSVAKFGLAWLNRDTFAISDTLWQDAVKQQAKTNDERRGLGWMLRSEENSSAGDLMSMSAYGHTGFTGTSLWIDPEKKLVTALLTNNIYYGRENRTIHDFRRSTHNDILKVIIA